MKNLSFRLFFFIGPDKSGSLKPLFLLSENHRNYPWLAASLPLPLDPRLGIRSPLSALSQPWFGPSGVRQPDVLDNNPSCCRRKLLGFNFTGELNDFSFGIVFFNRLNLYHPLFPNQSFARGDITGNKGINSWPAKLF